MVSGPFAFYPVNRVKIAVLPQVDSRKLYREEQGGFEELTSEFEGAKRIFWMEQTHGTTIEDADRFPSGRLVAGCDGLIAERPGTILAVRSADCMPIVGIYREGNKTLGVGIFHAGRKGMEKGMARQIFQVSAKRFGHHTAINAYYWIGPHICPTHHALDQNYPGTKEFLNEIGNRKSFVNEAKGNLMIDLSQWFISEMTGCGFTGLITRHGSYTCEEDAYPSYRIKPDDFYTFPTMVMAG